MKKMPTAVIATPATQEILAKTTLTIAKALFARMVPHVKI
jgi:hypothetical protein